MKRSLGEFKKDPKKTVVSVEDRKEVCRFSRKWFYHCYFFIYCLCLCSLVLFSVVFIETMTFGVLKNVN